MMERYEAILKALKAPFPKGIVEKGSRSYIPVQAYILRLEDVAKGDWEWRVAGMPVIDAANHLVIVKGELAILSTCRQGLGVAKLENLDANTVKSAISTAESEALRNACDKFQMGWKDLAPTRSWGKNPALVRYLNNDSAAAPSQPTPDTIIKDFDESIHSKVDFVTGRHCIKCQRELNASEVLFLSNLIIKQDYCPNCLPKQFIK